MADLSSFEITKRWKPENSDVIQLYSFPTPNGVKISIALEELGLPYEAHLANIMENDQKTDGFLALNPNGKIPSIVDPHGPDDAPVGLFESGAILLYLAEKNWQIDTFRPGRSTGVYSMAVLSDGRSWADVWAIRAFLQIRRRQDHRSLSDGTLSE